MPKYTQQGGYFSLLPSGPVLSPWLYNYHVYMTSFRDWVNGAIAIWPILIFWPTKKRSTLTSVLKMRKLLPGTPVGFRVCMTGEPNFWSVAIFFKTKIRPGPWHGAILISPSTVSLMETPDLISLAWLIYRTAIQNYSFALQQHTLGAIKEQTIYCYHY